MKTIKTLQDIEALNISNAYVERTLKQVFEFYQQVKDTLEGDLDPIMTIKDINDPYAVIYLDPVNQVFINKDYSGQIHIGTYKRFQYVTHHDRSQIKEETSLPQNFKKLNKKRILDWVNVTLAMLAEEEALSNQRQSKINSFLVQVRNAAPIFESMVTNERGYLESDQFVFKYEITESGYISQDIKLKGYPKDLNLFLKLTS